MAIKNIIAGGIGFSPGSVKFIPTRGFISGEVVADPTVDSGQYARFGIEDSTYPRQSDSDTTYPRSAGSSSTYPRV